MTSLWAMFVTHKEFKMDSRTSENYEKIDSETTMTTSGKKIASPEDENLISTDGGFRPEEIKHGHAGFQNFCKTIGINPTTRQVRRRAERLYTKALKNLIKERG